MHDSSVCPICRPADQCRGYPYLWRALAESRHLNHWLRIHDRLNGLTEPEPVLTRPGADPTGPEPVIPRRSCCGGLNPYLSPGPDPTGGMAGAEPGDPGVRPAG